jgi:hypothetical protein
MLLPVGGRITKIYIALFVRSSSDVTCGKTKQGLPAQLLAVHACLCELSAL